MSIHKKEEPGRRNSVREDHFSDDYRLSVFKLWYNNGKPTGDVLYELIPEQENLRSKPSVHTLRWWVNSHFVPKAAELDEELLDNLSKELIANKLEMLARHAQIAEQMIGLGLEYFEDHPIERENTALNLLVKGIEIERESRGITTREKIETMSDSQLMKEIESLVNTSQLTDTVPNE